LNLIRLIAKFNIFWQVVCFQSRFCIKSLFEIQKKHFILACKAKIYGKEKKNCVLPRFCLRPKVASKILACQGEALAHCKKAIFWSSLVFYLFTIQILYKSPFGIQKDLYLDVQGDDLEKIKYNR
jgi:hypothetical protein